MRPFSLLIKPASADCNLRCAYCFYLKKCALYPHAKAHRMSEAVLERMVAGYMATDQPTYAFGWQGGEPTLMGLDFFKRATELQKAHGKPGAVVSNGLQTNTTLIDDAFAKHLGEYKFLVGVSLDGPPEVHNHYRKYADGRGSHANVTQGIERLKQHNVAFNILTLVNDHNVGRAREIYQYLCNEGFLFHQYIPCVEFDEKGGALPFTISGRAWGDFLCEIYDEWSVRDTRRVSVRFFDSILSYMVDKVRNVCHMGRDCRQYFVVEHNGDVYPCDFFVEPDLRLGNVAEGDWGTMQESPKYKEFGKQKSAWADACKGCRFLAFCSGDCLKNRFYGSSDPRRLSWLCEGWQQFYEHALPGFRRLADEILKERQLARMRSVQPGPRKPARVGRNDLCPCGSGKKFKNCCMG